MVIYNLSILIHWFIIQTFVLETGSFEIEYVSLHLLQPVASQVKQLEGQD